MRTKLKQKRVENSLAKGEIARFEQILLLSQCFQKSSAADVSKCVYRWERVKSIMNSTIQIDNWGPVKNLLI